MGPQKLKFTLRIPKFNNNLQQNTVCAHSLCWTLESFPSRHCRLHLRLPKSSTSKT